MAQRPITVRVPDGTEHRIDADSEQEAVARARWRFEGKPPDPPEPALLQQEEGQASLQEQLHSPQLGLSTPKENALHPLAQAALDTALTWGVAAAVPPVAPFVAGSRIPGIANLGRQFMQAPKIAQNLGRATGEGAAIGGALAPEGETGAGATVGGTLGAGAGLLPYVGTTAKAAWRFGRSAGNPAGRARETLGRAVQGADRSILENPNAMATDLHPGVTHLVRQGLSNDSTEMATRLAARQEGAAGRLMQKADEVLEGPPSVSQLTTEGAERTKVAEDLYTQAYGEELPEATRAIIARVRARPSYQEAMQSARKRLAEDDVFLDEGTIETVEAADKYIIAMRQMVTDATKREDKDMVKRLLNTLKPIQDSLETAVPAYGRAAKFAHETRQLDDAFTAGRTLFDKANPDGTARLPSMTTQALSEMTPAARRHFRAGIQDNLFKGASQLEQTANIVKAFSNRGTRAQLEAVLDKKTFGIFQKFIDDETTFYKAYVATLGPEGAALPDTLSEVVQTAGDVVRAGAWYSPFAVNSLVQNLTKKVLRESDDEMYREMMHIMLSRTAPEASAGLVTKGVSGLGATPAAAFQERDHSR